MLGLVPRETQTSIAEAYNVSVAALQLANPQLSESDYELPGEVVQIPAACSNQANVHLIVPGDTIDDLAKDYDVDLECLENDNPQITDFSALDPGDCIQIPSSCGPSSSAISALISFVPSTSGTWVSTNQPTSSLSASWSVASSSTASASSPSGSCCSFTITASGGVSGIAGQLSDGQIRVNGSYPPATFCISNGQVTDSSGRGCILTRKSDLSQPLNDKELWRRVWENMDSEQVGTEEVAEPIKQCSRVK